MKLVLLLLAAILAVALCSSMSVATPMQTAKAGKYTVELATQPAVPVVGDNQITLTVKDGGKPVNGAGVALHLDMVGMPMPADVKTKPGALDGQYVVTVNLAMVGQWTLTANIKGMAGMDMPGDGKATFTLTVPPAPDTSTTAPSPSATPPATPVAPTAPSGLSWPLIIGAVAVIGVIVGIVIARGRRKQ